MENNKTGTIEAKDFEIIVWLLPGVIFTFYLLYFYNLNYLIKQAAVFLDLFWAFSPFAFAMLFSLLYNDFPIFYLLSVLNKSKTEKE